MRGGWYGYRARPGPRTNDCAARGSIAYDSHAPESIACDPSGIIFVALEATPTPGEGPAPIPSPHPSQILYEF
jgi:hypothetical protein